MTPSSHPPPAAPASAAPESATPESAASSDVTLADVQAAAARIAGRIVDTPCLHSQTLSALTGCEVWLKFENLQFTASFKERGALNKLLQLTSGQRVRGVLAVSAGNHAQGVALHAQRLGIPATIVMPRFTPSVKVEATRAFGPTIVLEGETLEDAKVHGLALAQRNGATFVHPYDDPAVIAGQGTIALEMLRAAPQLDGLVISVGGGGLIGGMSVAARALRPSIDIVGVQTERFPSMYNAFHGTGLPQGAGSIAEGIAVGQAGELTSRIVRERVADVLLVREADIEQAIVLLLEIEKTVAEGAAAAGLAALLAHRERFAGRRIGLVICGGNIDPLLLSAIIRRAMVRSGRLARIRIEIRDRPGALAAITAVLAESAANIEEIHHQRAFSALSAERAELEVVIHTRDESHVREVLAALAARGYNAARF